MNTIVTKTEIKLDSKPVRNRNAKPVYCITNGKVYASEIDAAKEIGVCNDLISRVCRGVAKTAKGEKYCFVNDMPTHIMDISNAMQAATKDANAYRTKEAYEKRKHELYNEIEARRQRIAKEQEKLNMAEAMYAAIQKE